MLFRPKLINVWLIWKNVEVFTIIIILAEKTGYTIIPPGVNIIYNGKSELFRAKRTTQGTEELCLTSKIDPCGCSSSPTPTYIPPIQP